MKTIKWTGKKGNEIELRASCEITIVPDRVNLDGDVVEVGTKERTTGRYFTKTTRKRIATRANSRRKRWIDKQKKNILTISTSR